MTHALILNSSAAGDSSASSQLAQEFVRRLRHAEARLTVTVRDLGRDPPPHLTADRLPGLAGKDTGPAARDAAALSGALIGELRSADLLVVASPMYNFGITSALKTWFDHVVRAGVTFQYSAAGPQGLLTGKRAVVIETRGGVYSEGPAKGMDAQEPHLRAMLGLIGIADQTFVRAEGLAISPETRAQAIAAATEQLAALAGAAAKAA